jgi:hypothetical protein
MTTSLRLAAATVALGLLAGAGCSSDYPRTVPVYGKVTLDGGEWPAEGRLFFTSLESAKGFPQHPGIAHFARSGRFRAGTWDHADGLMPGKYKVHVECWKSPPAMEQTPVSFVAEKYQSGRESDIVLTVPADSRGEKVSWDIPGAGPQRSR